MRLRSLRLALVFALSCSRQPSPDLDATSPAADAGADALTSTCIHPAVEPRCHGGACLVPAGCYLRGSPPDEFMRCRYCEDLRETTLTHALAVGQFEVTQGEWQAQGHPVRQPVPEIEDGDGRTCFEPSCPISRMTWFEAVAFANEKSRREGKQECIALEGCSGKIGEDFDCSGYRQTTASYYDCDGYRLPTSAESEYITRAGTRTAFFTVPFEPPKEDCAKIEHLMEGAWYCANSGQTTHPVGQRRPNAWGIHDLVGNVSELTVSEVVADTRLQGAATDPESVIATSGIFSVRGGMFTYPQMALRSADQADRHYLRLDVEHHFGHGLGFRLVRSLSPAEAASW